MSIRFPKTRYHLNIGRKDNVLEIGSGHNPHPRSNILVDKYIECNDHRKCGLRKLKHQKFIEADGERLPFKDQEFDYVICNQVLEHAADPAAFISEICRVAKKGYIEVPSLIGEYLFPKETHKWLCLILDSKLILVEKEKYWNKNNVDLGFLFLVYLRHTSLSFKMLRRTRPNLTTMRYEFNNEAVRYEINPDNPDYIKYFNGTWDRKMIETFFPKKNKIAEVFSSLFSIFSLMRMSVRLRIRELRLQKMK